jgi:hypothetical protein
MLDHLDSGTEKGMKTDSKYAGMLASDSRSGQT